MNLDTRDPAVPLNYAVFLNRLGKVFMMVMVTVMVMVMVMVMVVINMVWFRCQKQPSR